MVSFDAFKDVCIPTATNSDGEQICMYVCMLSVTNLSTRWLTFIGV